MNQYVSSYDKYTADALLTQRALATYRVEKRRANYHFAVKNNQQRLLEDISSYFPQAPASADFTQTGTGQASPQQILADNRKHWSVESCHYIIDWNYDEHHSRIRTGHGPENITRLRRFAIGLLKSRKPNETIPEKMKKLMLNMRAVFDCLK